MPTTTPNKDFYQNVAQPPTAKNSTVYTTSIQSNPNRKDAIQKDAIQTAPRPLMRRSSTFPLTFSRLQALHIEYTHRLLPSYLLSLPRFSLKALGMERLSRVEVEAAHAVMRQDTGLSSSPKMPTWSEGRRRGEWCERLGLRRGRMM